MRKGHVRNQPMNQGAEMLQVAVSSSKKTQVEFAKGLELSPSLVSQLVNNMTPTYEQAFKLEKKLKIPMNSWMKPVKETP